MTPGKSPVRTEPGQPGPAFTLDWARLVLAVDGDFLVINKPPGLPTLPDGYDPTRPHVRSVLEPEFGRVWIVHRLDRQTSGVLLVARSASVHRALNLQFDAHLPQKIYHALVMGCPTWESQEVDQPLKPDGDRRHRTVISLQGKPALTHLSVLQRFAAHALLEAAPHTGRTHQIRAHLAFCGLPIAADSLYGGGESLPPFLARMGLHAHALSSQHPATGQPLRCEAPYPDDLAAALEGLRSTA